ncbi:MAG: HupE/UreJ family protein [Pirellulales bacterium]
MMAGIRAALLLLAWSWGSLALAHKPSDSYLRITSGDERLTAEWDIALKDLEFLIGLDANRDGEITWGEVKGQRQAIAAHALSRLHLTADGHACDLQLSELLVTQHSDGGYAVLALETSCPGDVTVLTIDYNLLFDVDPTHRGLVLYTHGAYTSTNVLSPDNPTLELRTGEGSVWHTLADYLGEGVWHIWIGYDHILFLLSLLLPAVLVRRDNRWQAVNSFRPACMAVLKIVTVFTIAHSITLWLAVMEYVTLPSRLVESTIALSIVITALNNLYPVLPLSGWAIAFVFGLVHGFGFANVLLDLGLSSLTLGVALLGFNVGVELGQIAIVLVFLPLAFLLRGTAFYRWAVLRFGSVLVAIVGGIWLVERVFEVTIFGG